MYIYITNSRIYLIREIYISFYNYTYLTDYDIIYEILKPSIFFQSMYVTM